MNTASGSQSLANMHFRIGLIGILLYVSSMWVSGIMQGLMLNATKDGGTLLKYVDFLDTLNAILPMMLARAFGGLLYLAGFVVLADNVFRTIRAGKPVNETREVVVLRKKEADVDTMGFLDTFRNDPVVFSILGILFLCLWFFLPPYGNLVALICAGVLTLMAIAPFKRTGNGWSVWHEKLLEN